MRLELRWDLRVPDALRALPDGERRRVLVTILALEDDPQPPATRSLPGKPSWFRLDEGRFCVLYAIDSVDSTLTIYAVTKDGEVLGPELY